MNNVGEKFLPLGSVVMLKGASKRLMITGFCTMAADDESGVMYDYSGCMYPEGVISSDRTAVFNHNQIEKVYHLGLVDEEEKTFKTKLVQLLNSQTMISESAPQSIREQEGIAVAPQSVEVPVTPVAEPTPAVPVQPAGVPVPPIGPGLSGYVAPVAEPTPATVQPAGVPVPPIGQGLPGYVAPVAEPTPAVPVQSAEVPVPPIGPGLPGYVAPVTVTQPSVEPIESNGFQFDANGNIITSTPVDEQSAGEGGADVQSFQFDENGTVVSA